MTCINGKPDTCHSFDIIRGTLALRTIVTADSQRHPSGTFACTVAILLPPDAP
jgi:hypothetical protein